MTMIRFKTAAAAATAIGILAAAPAMAATVSYDLSINDPIFNSNSGNANVPDFQLTNTSDMGIGITDFSLTIGDTSFNFDFVRIENVETDPGADLVATLQNVGTSNNGVGEDFISYTFAGFDPGDVFQFEVDVDPDAGSSPFADFRDVLFPLATVSLTFSDGTTLSQVLDPDDTSTVGFSFTQAPSPVPLPAGMPLLLGALAMGGAFASHKRLTKG